MTNRNAVEPASMSEPPRPPLSTKTRLAWLDVLRGEEVHLAWEDAVVDFGADGRIA